MRMPNVTYLSFLSLSLLVLACLLYPGSTYNNPDTSYYKIFENTLSETGRTVNYRGEILMWSRIFFNFSLISGGLAIGLFINRNIRLVIFKFLAFVSSVSFIAITLFPVDQAQNIHNYLFFIAIVLTSINLIVLGLYNNNRLSLASGIILLAYVFFMIGNPVTTISPLIHTAHVILQKIAVLIIFITIFLSEKYVKTS